MRHAGACAGCCLTRSQRAFERIGGVCHAGARASCCAKLSWPAFERSGGVRNAGHVIAAAWYGAGKLPIALVKCVVLVHFC